MSKILITGRNSIICKEFVKLLPNWCEPSLVNDNLSNLDNIGNWKDTFNTHNYFLIAHGTFTPNQIYHKMKENEIVEIMKINLLSTIMIIELALENPSARICVIGSESGLKGSKNVAYGLAKTALHKYVKERKIVSPNQQIVCVAPSLIEDSRITKNRMEIEPGVVEAALKSNPKGRGLFGREIATMIHHLLFVDEGYTTNTVIHMNGGKYARS